MFCVKCGKEALEGEVLCEEHYLEGKELFSIDNFNLQICSNCRKVKTDTGWEFENEEEFVKKEVRDHIETKYEVSLDIQLKKKGKDYSAKIKARGKIPPSKKEKEQEATVLVKVTRHLCPMCQKRRGGYYEAVIQVRGEHKERIMDNLDNFLKGDDLTKIEPVKGGYDIFLMEKGKAKKVAKQLSDNYKIKESYKLAGVKKDKKLYRNYYSVK